jgi:hypothetical protein
MNFDKQYIRSTTKDEEEEQHRKLWHEKISAIESARDFEAIAH